MYKIMIGSYRPYFCKDIEYEVLDSVTKLYLKDAAGDIRCRLIVPNTNLIEIAEEREEE